MVDTQNILPSQKKRGKRFVNGVIQCPQGMSGKGLKKKEEKSCMYSCKLWNLWCQADRHIKGFTVTSQTLLRGLLTSHDSTGLLSKCARTKIHNR